jgi:hypothetical protein
MAVAEGRALQVATENKRVVGSGFVKCSAHVHSSRRAFPKDPAPLAKPAPDGRPARLTVPRQIPIEKEEKIPHPQGAAQQSVGFGLVPGATTHPFHFPCLPMNSSSTTHSLFSAADRPEPGLCNVWLAAGPWCVACVRGDGGRGEACASSIQFQSPSRYRFILCVSPAEVWLSQSGAVVQRETSRPSPPFWASRRLRT